MKGLVFALFLVSVTVSHIIPSWEDNDYDLILLSETEALNAIPASLRLNPTVYESEAEARKAAEKELALLGEPVESSKTLKKIAEKEALNIAQNAEKDPMHDGMEGLKVNLGELEDPEEAIKKEKEREAAAALQKAAKKAMEEAKNEAKLVEPEPVVDTQNEQESKPQFSDSDVPLVSHARKGKKEQTIKKVPTVNTLSIESHLLSDEGTVFGTRPSAPQFGFQFPFPMPQMAKIQSPELSQSQTNPNQLPAFPFPFMSQANMQPTTNFNPFNPFGLPAGQQQQNQKMVDPMSEMMSQFSKMMPQYMAPQNIQNLPAFPMNQFPQMFPPMSNNFFPAAAAPFQFNLTPNK